MILEIVIAVCLIGIFVILARRLPDVIKKPKLDLNKIPDNDIANTSKKNELVSIEGNDMEIADRFFEKGNHPQAEKYYLKAATHDPDNPKIYNRLGIIYLEQKNYRDAKDAFEAALKLDSKKASRHVNYGLANMNLKNFSEAVKSFEEAIKLEPKNDKYQNLLKEAKYKGKLVEKKQ